MVEDPNDIDNIDLGLDYAIVCTDGPLAVSLSRFEAKRTGDVVRFEWETATETGNAGFNLFVETVDGMEQINESLVPSSVIDSVEPVAYSYSAAVAGDLFYIEMVDIQNRTDLYGPFAVTESTATADFDGKSAIWIPMISH